MSLIPPPEGWHLAPRNPDGTLKGRLDPKEQEAREAKRKTNMELYFARSREAHERLVKAAKGIKDKPEIPAPEDELDFVMLNILADPATLDSKGSGGLRTVALNKAACLSCDPLTRESHPEAALPEGRNGGAL